MSIGRPLVTQIRLPWEVPFDGTTSGTGGTRRPDCRAGVARGPSLAAWDRTGAQSFRVVWPAQGICDGRFANKPIAFGIASALPSLSIRCATLVAILSAATGGRWPVRRTGNARVGDARCRPGGSGRASEAAGHPFLADAVPLRTHRPSRQPKRRKRASSARPMTASRRRAQAEAGKSPKRLHGTPIQLKSVPHVSNQCHTRRSRMF